MKYFLTFFLAFSFLPLFCQPFFSKSIDLTGIGNVLSGDDAFSIKEVPDGYLLLVGSLCSFTPFLACLQLVKTDEEGNVLWIQEMSDLPNSINSPRPVNMPVSISNQLLFTGDYIDDEGVRKFMFGWVFLDEDLWDFFSFAFDEISYGHDIHLLPNEEILIYGGKGTDTERLMFLAKFNNQDSLLWERTIPLEGSWWEQGGNMQVLPNGDVLLICSTYTPGNSSEPGTGLTRTDSLGNILWQKQIGDDNFGFACDTKVVRLRDDGGLVALACNDADATIFWLNHEGSTQNTFTFDYSPKTINQIKIAANGDIIGCGNNSNISFPNASGGGGGWLFRISPQGELLWERTYIEDPMMNPTLFSFADITETEEGYLALTGKRRDPDPNGVSSTNTWLMVVGADGCLQEDCGELVYLDNEDVSLPADQQKWMQVYPQPVDDLLHIELYSPVKNGQFSLYSNLGERVMSQSIVGHQVAYQLELRHLPAAVYVLRLEVEGRVLQVDQVVVR